MAKITSKYQVTVPKTIADRYSIRPGDEIDWVPAGDVIRVIPSGKHAPAEDPVGSRLRLFDQATERHRRRPGLKRKPPRNRGWSREGIYERGRSN